MRLRAMFPSKKLKMIPKKRRMALHKITKPALPLPSSQLLGLGGELISLCFKRRRKVVFRDIISQEDIELVINWLIINPGLDWRWRTVRCARETGLGLRKVFRII